jgi:hypothetical protein
MLAEHHGECHVPQHWHRGRDAPRGAEIRLRVPEGDASRPAESEQSRWPDRTSGAASRKWRHGAAAGSRLSACPSPWPPRAWPEGAPAAR